MSHPQSAWQLLEERRAESLARLRRTHALAVSDDHTESHDDEDCPGADDCDVARFAELYGTDVDVESLARSLGLQDD